LSVCDRFPVVTLRWRTDTLGDLDVALSRSFTAAATEEKIGWIREAAGERFDQLELNTLPERRDACGRPAHRL
jgi:hypothetical protein